MCGIALLLERSQPEQPSDVEAGWLPALREAIHPRGPDAQGEQELLVGEWRMHMLGAVLHMRGPEPRVQPAMDTEGNALLWNGEVFGGDLGGDQVKMPGPEENDTDAVLAALGADDGNESGRNREAVAQHCEATLAGLAGPWAFAYFHRGSGTLHFGRDRLGRRSLCLLEDPSGRWIVLASTTAAIPPALLTTEPAPQWREVTVEGLWQLDLGGGPSSSLSPCLVPWLAPPRVTPAAPAASVEEAAALLLRALDEAVRRRVASVPPPLPALERVQYQEAQMLAARVGVLYSGGIDCQVLAALAHRHVPPDEPIDLVNVCFDAANHHRSPDRLGALAGLSELCKACPGRQWRLVCVDVAYEEVRGVEARIKRLIQPCATPMDFNIATSFYFAARAHGRLVLLSNAPNATGAALGLLRYGQAEDDAQAKAAAASAAAAAAAAEGHGPCGNAECRRVAKPACRRRLCGNCCTKAQRRALEALGEEEQEQGQGQEEREVAAAAILCQGHKLNKKYLPPWLRPLPQQQQHRPPSPPPPAAAVSTGAPFCGPTSQAPYRSRARALLLGIGADEQLAGYGRHRSTFGRGGIEALGRELTFDLGRLWTRNLGRDDRCVAAHGREARFPYLDEDVMAMLRALPTHLKFDLEEPRGIGDKKVLRHIAGSMLGLESAARLVKRAIQFGSRIAREANTHNFGSHRSGKQTRWLRKPSGTDWGVPVDEEED